MKFRIWIIFLYCNLAFLFAQNSAYLVEYEYFPNPDLYAESMVIPAELYVNDQQLLYKLKLTEKKEQLIYLEDSISFKSVAGKKDKHLGMNLKNSTYLFMILTNNNKYTIEDKVEQHWEIDPSETKTILGFNCIKAATKFRGRNYTAWFAPEIASPYGPWKFKGLPGLILEVYSDDYKYRFNAVSYHNSPNESHRETTAFYLNELDKNKKWSRKEYLKYNYDRNLMFDKNTRSSIQGLNESYSTVVAIEKDMSFNSDK